MFLFLSFLVAISALIMLGDMATSYYPTSNPAAVVTLLIYSFVCIVREVKKEDDMYFDDFNGGYNRNYSSNWKGNTYAGNNSYNNNAYGYNNIKPNEKVEVFAPDKKEESKDDDRPKVLHYPSQKEARDKIAELSKSRWWRGKRKLMAFLGVDITKKFYQPTYVKEEVAVKGNSKEDHSRFMPKQTNSNNVGWWQKQETEEYNIVAKRVGRSCDIAFDGETFVEENIN